MKIADSDKVPSTFPVPSLNESYCGWSTNSTDEIRIDVHAIARSTIVVVITLSIIVSNLIFIVTINSEFYAKITNQQVGLKT